ncbi:Asp-tRNA(Asn)/Glu-tRNA(Gln) amidotransferase subunit GatC [Sabulicella rubraurantiaca]|uniref:Asp-tRNA(Asn)/Glu-tRNA(Gln) amidotransferase subunit GatC n=1 Tax=Sabulicella rubraurantiaca TaxID=2811429 RepID=UPI001A968AB1|nr:Asp-tRNA(Asn)/Glu-tRNA(Gln) amidotransferase subunit GatC [Sabulicella rubraurantiaca]
MSLDAETVKRVARLARLRVEENEIPGLQAELNGILGWVEQLQSVDTEGVEPLAGGNPGGASLPWREDRVSDGGKVDEVLANAPDREGDYFGVPKVVE